MKDEKNRLTTISGFNPANIVPGIGFSPDKML
ncbi:hypothetical protein SAMN05216326_1413 [Nitrosomonas marina]|uniref:Uncharacterized protein n=1 Tax=Nitrosomonas marina TaxID=917 RepID=A0A1I0FQ57_9PROT|nr:hypothetical protein SAMN05216326_1413 [Nitrosomonas marina]